MATLESLPNEILYHIATMCPPITYYNLALAYKQVHAISRKHYKRLFIVQRCTDNTVYQCLLDGTLHGTYISYCGAVVVKYLNYHKGVLDGFQLYYYNNGRPRALTLYINGKRHGTQKKFYPNGDIENIKVFDMDKNIREVEYYLGEKPAKATKYKKNGYKIEYDATGYETCRVKNFPNGRRIYRPAYLRTRPCKQIDFKKYIISILQV